MFSILIVTGIYTASVPLLWQTAFRLAEEGSLRFKRIAVILAAAGIAASLLLPFNRLMNIVYVLIGYLGFLLLAVYWFNPLVWAAYLLFCRDKINKGE